MLFKVVNREAIVRIGTFVLFCLILQVHLIWKIIACCFYATHKVEYSELRYYFWFTDTLILLL